MSQKCTPKSCSCSACKRGKHMGSKGLVKIDERKFRHGCNQDLKTKVERTNDFDELEEIDTQQAPIGNYYD